MTPGKGRANEPGFWRAANHRSPKGIAGVDWGRSPFTHVPWRGEMTLRPKVVLRLRLRLRLTGSV